MGVLIAIDGVDASGKETQSEMLYNRLVKENFEVRRMSFPAYDKPSSVLVKEYLGGKYGENPDDVNAYAASVLFAVDRFSTYRTDWIKDYESNKIIIADRYVSSNLIHQASKITDKDEKLSFVEWAEDLEYNKLGVPKPTVTIFLDMPTEFAQILMKDRNNKITGDTKKDIHERNSEYLKKSYNNAVDIAKELNWTKISCVEDVRILTPDEIHEKVYDAVKSLIC